MSRIENFVRTRFLPPSANYFIFIPANPDLFFGRTNTSMFTARKTANQDASVFC